MSNNKSLNISAGDVQNFKIVYCNENSIIKNLLKKEFLPYFNGRILDVGGGTADILSEIIPERTVMHLDVLDFSEVKIPQAHRRVTGDFFNTKLLNSLMPIDMVFMSHVQQFIDGDPNKLRSQIDLINAKRIILVEDLNDDFLGEVMRFSLTNFFDANPEVKIDGFPFGYEKIKSIPFMATLTCPTYAELAKQCLYLMDLAHSDKNIVCMIEFLEKNLAVPQFSINQSINIYEKLV